MYHAKITPSTVNHRFTGFLIYHISNFPKLLVICNNIVCNVIREVRIDAFDLPNNFAFPQEAQGFVFTSILLSIKCCFRHVFFERWKGGASEPLANSRGTYRVLHNAHKPSKLSTFKELSGPILIKICMDCPSPII